MTPQANPKNSFSSPEALDTANSNKKGAQDESETKDIVLCFTCSQFITKVAVPHSYESETRSIAFYQTKAAFQNTYRCLECPGLLTLLDLFMPEKDNDEFWYLNLEKDLRRGCTIRGQIYHPIIGFRSNLHEAAESYSFMPLKSKERALEKNEVIGRVWDPKYLSIDLIRGWLDWCDTKHGPKCRETIAPPPNHRIMLIDTKNYCLVDIREKQIYAALSYVWGTAHPFQTTKANVEKLRQHRALKCEIYHVPDTIKDAILLAASLSIPYLWVDSLCIIQDDEILRNIHLNSMAAIYANAYVTFVAAEGNHANYGIPGVPGGSISRHTPCYTFCTKDGDRYQIRHNRETWPSYSTWDFRGWTFQEGLFSTRLIVLDRIVTWHCAAQFSQEDVEISPVAMPRGFSWFHRIRFKPAIPSSLVRRPLRAWAELVERYNMRRLTRDEDGLRAIAGISEVMKKHLEDDIVFGIPLKSFEIGLLWRSNCSLQRRTAKIPGTHINLLPSWSWAGWQGNLNLESWVDVDRELLLPGNDKAISVITKGPMSPKIITNPPGCCPPTVECPHLFLETWTFTIEPQTGILAKQNKDGFRLYSGTGNLGLLFTPESWDAQGILEAGQDADWPGTPIELMALSIAIHKVNHLAKYFPELEASREESIEIYNVLWIHWEDGVANRMALGIILSEAWRGWSTKKRNITLG